MLIHRTAVIQRRNRACDLAAGRNQQITVRIFLFIEILTVVLLGRVASRPVIG